MSIFYNLHRIQLDTFLENVRAIRTYEKCGFVREGILRKAFWTSKGYRDRIVMGLLFEDWQKNPREKQSLTVRKEEDTKGDMADA